MNGRVRAGDYSTSAKADWAARHRFLLLAAIAAGALFLRVVQIEREALWADESHLLLIKHWPVIDLLFRPVETSPGLYYILAKWFVPDGASTALVRAMPVLFGVLSVLVMYFVARRLFSPFLSLAVTAMLAVSPAMVDFSQESRPYSLLILLVLLSAAGVLEWVRGLKGDSVPYGALALFFVAALLAFYTHFTSIFWVVPAVLAGREITDRMGSQKAKRAYVVAQILILLLAIPEAVRAVGRAKFGSFGFLENVTPARLVVQWGDVVLPSGLWNGRAGHGSPVSAAVLALFVAIIVARLWPARAQLLEWARENPARPLVIATLTVVPLFVWCFGYLVTPIFMYRSILLGAPGFILFLALADQFYRWPIASSTFVALSAAALISNGTVRAKEQWLSVAQTLKAESQHGDGIVMCPDWRISSLLHALGPLAERPLYIVRNSTVIPLLLQDGTGRWEKIAHQLVFRDWVEGVLQGGEPKPDLRYAPTPARLWLVDSECPADDRAALAKWFAPASPRTVAVFRTRPLDPGIRVSLVEGQPISRPVAMREAAVDTSGR